MGSLDRTGGVAGSIRRIGVGGVVAALVLAFALASARHASADSSVTVSGACTIDLAVAYADGTAEPNCAPATATGTTTIVVPASANKYTVAGTLSITKPTVINGAGAATTTIDGGNAVTVFNIASGVPVTISGVTISGGNSGVMSVGCTGSGITFACPAEDGNNGGGIFNQGSLTLQNAVVTGNVAGTGTRPFTSTFVLVICFTAPNCPAKVGQSAGSGGDGGGIFNTGQLTVTNSTISANAAGNGGDGTDGVSGTGTDAGAGQNGGSGGFGGSGGGLYNQGTATISNSAISGNQAGNGGRAGAGSAATAGASAGGSAGFPGGGEAGGAIFNSGTLTITNSTISGNASGVGGNGALGGAGNGAASGSSTASASGGPGGGSFSDAAATVTFANDTFAGNIASAGGTGGTGAGTGGQGGAIVQSGVGLLQLSFVTVSANKAFGAAGGVDHTGIGAITEADSVIALNTGTPANCVGAIADNGNNIIFGDPSCPGKNADPKLAALAANGGATQTLALTAGSAAIDEVPIMACPLTTDERGISRPQGAACDAGAYEVAPPGIASPSASASSTTAGTVTASINPHLTSHDTTVMVKYGTSTAYGSTTPAQDVGASNTPLSFSAALSGLSPSTTYHAQIVASNGDGTANSPDITFTTASPPPPLKTAVASVAGAGAALKVKLSCNGGTSGQKCSGSLALTAHLKKHGSTTVAVTAAAKKKKPKPKPKPKPAGAKVTVGTGSYSIASGQTQTVTITLNATGKKLLAQFYALPATLAVTGASSFTKTVKLSYTVIRSPIAFTWSFGSSSTVAQLLTVSKIPTGAGVVVSCHGGGCPFATRKFAPHAGKVALVPALKSSALAPGAVLTITITAPNHVGKVASFTMRAGREPSLSETCLPPGAHSPSRCVK